MDRGRALWWTEADSRSRRDRDPVVPLEARARARELFARARELFASWGYPSQYAEREVLDVLADALLESDAPELGQDLAYALQGLDIRPGARRGTRVSDTVASYRNLRFVREHIDEELSWPSHADRLEYDRRERHSALNELRTIAREWQRRPAAERVADVIRIADWLETPDGVVTLEDRTDWIFGGSFGRGPRLIAREIAAASRQNRERQLFELILAFDDRIAAPGALRVWNRLTPEAQANVTRAMRNSLRAYGAVVDDAQRGRRDGR